MRCSNCSAENLEEDLVCINCGHRTVNICKFCGKVLEKEHLFCPYCGKSLDNQTYNNKDSNNSINEQKEAVYKGYNF